MSIVNNISPEEMQENKLVAARIVNEPVNVQELFVMTEVIKGLERLKNETFTEERLFRVVFNIPIPTNEEKTHALAIVQFEDLGFGLILFKDLEGDHTTFCVGVRSIGQIVVDFIKVFDNLLLINTDYRTNLETLSAVEHLTRTTQERVSGDYDPNAPIQEELDL